MLLHPYGFFILLVSEKSEVSDLAGFRSFFVTEFVTEGIR